MTSNLTPILEKVSNSDTIILSSQIYLHSVTGAMRSFLEKLIFQYLVYDTNHTSRSLNENKYLITINNFYTTGRSAYFQI